MALTAKVAVPLPRVPVPRLVAPSKKVTVPVAAEGARLAVRVMLAPAAGLVLEAESVVVEAVSVVTATADDVPAA
jgi:hypothetical protein